MKAFIAILFGLILVVPFSFATPVHGCGFAFPGSYELQNNVTSSITCFIVRVDNFELDCQGHTVLYDDMGLGFYNGVEINNANNVTIKNCHFEDATTSGNLGIGIYINQSNSVNILDSSALTKSPVFGAGALVFNSSKVELRRNEFSTDSTVSGFGSIGIMIQESTDVYADDNNLTTGGSSDNNHGVLIQTSHSVGINRNIISSSGSSSTSGIAVVNPVFSVTVNNNSISTGSGSNNHGITLRRIGSNNSFENNLIETKGSSSHGIHLENGTTSNSLRGNEIVIGNGSSSYGLFIEDADNDFSGSVIRSDANWIYMSSQARAGLSGLKFESQDSSIRLGLLTPVLGPLFANKGDIVLGYNLAEMNSTKLTQLNTSARISLNNLNFTRPKSIVDWNFDGQYADCSSPDCQTVSYVGGEFVFDVVSMASFSSAETPLALLCGDCNNNGQVDILDALTAAREAAALPTGITPTGVLQCDVTIDGMIDILDALQIARFSSGLIPSLNC